MTHDGAGLLEGMPPTFMAARYHSLCVDPATLPAGAARDRDERGGPAWSWASATRSLPMEGVQFHPESVLTPDGPAPARELPAPGRRGRGLAARRRDRVVRDARAWPSAEPDAADGATAGAR